MEDLRMEFERLGADAQHLLLTTPRDAKKEGGEIREEEEEEPEDQFSGSSVGGCVSTTTPTPQQLACSTPTHVQQLSEDVWGGGDCQLPTTSLVWWYQPYGWTPHCWASLVLACPSCQGRSC